MDKKIILIIEDEFDIRKNIETILTENGYEIISAPNGNIGIQLAKTIIPHLIICDIMMPGVDGYAVFQELSKEKSTRSIPFIYLTAKTSREELRIGMEIGADDYLFKPFKIDEILNAVESRLKRIDILKMGMKTDREDFSIKYNSNDKLFLQYKNKPNLVTVKDIVYISANNQYSNLFMNNTNSFLIRKSIADWEEQLPDNFLRIHRSTIINSEFIVKIENSFKSTFLIFLYSIEKPFIVSKRYSAKLRQNKLN